MNELQNDFNKENLSLLSIRYRSKKTTQEGGGGGEGEKLTLEEKRNEK